MREKWQWAMIALALGGALGVLTSPVLADPGPKPPAPGLGAPTFALGGTVPGDKPGTTIQAPSKDFDFKFGLRPLFQIRRVEGLTFDQDRPEPARQCDSNANTVLSGGITGAINTGPNNCAGDFSIRLENQIFFRAKRDHQYGPLWNLDLVLETDGGLDGTRSDSLHRPGLERFLGEYRIGDLVQAGLPIYFGIGWWLPIWDPFTIVDADDDPSIRLVYAGDLFQVEVMWTQDVRGDLGNAFGAPTTNDDLEFIRGRVIIPLGDYTVQPTFYYQNDSTVQSGAGRDVQTWYAGGTFSGKPKGLPIDFFVTGYTLQGEAGIHAGSVNANGVAIPRTDFDVSSFFIGGDIGYTFIPGWRVHAGVAFAKGDDGPFDNKLKGFTDLAALRVGPNGNGASLNFRGNGSFPAWGSPLISSQLPTGHGVGPSIGSITRDARGAAGNGFDPFAGTAGNVSPCATPGACSVTVAADGGNNGGFGRGDNPGMIDVFAGVTGKLSDTWSLNFLVNFLWFESPQSVEAEINQARCIAAPGGSAATCGTSSAVATGSNNFPDGRGVANISSYFGTQFSLDLTWRPIPQFALSLQPSVLFPGEAVEDMGRFAPGVQKAVDDMAWSFQTELVYQF